jgi:hypothetical protein
MGLRLAPVSEFFELPKVRPRRRQRVKVEDDEGWGPPSLLLPGRVAKDVVIAASEDHAVVMEGIACYPSGLSFELRTVGLYYYDHEFNEYEPSMGSWVRRAGEKELPPGLLRFGVEYSDGQKATTLEADHGWHRSEDDGRLRLQLGGGGGGGATWSWRIWITPLPPDGPVVFVCEWPAFGIEETRKSIPGSRFRRAAERARGIF